MLDPENGWSGCSVHHTGCTGTMPPVPTHFGMCTGSGMEQMWGLQVDRLSAVSGVSWHEPHATFESTPKPTGSSQGWMTGLSWSDPDHK